MVWVVSVRLYLSLASGNITQQRLCTSSSRQHRHTRGLLVGFKSYWVGHSRSALVFGCGISFDLTRDFGPLLLRSLGRPHTLTPDDLFWKLIHHPWTKTGFNTEICQARRTL